MWISQLNDKAGRDGVTPRRLKTNENEKREMKKTKIRRLQATVFTQAAEMAGVAGFEPTMRESKSRALPLGDTPRKGKWGE